MALRSFIFILFSSISFAIFSQNSLADYEDTISKLKGENRIEKYIQLVGEQASVSPQTAIKLAQAAISENNTKKFPRQHAKILHILGDIYFFAAEYTRSFPLLLKSAEIYEKIHDVSDLPMVYISTGRLYRKAQNDCEKTKVYYHKAEAIYESTNNLQELATVHNYLGNVTESCDKDLEKALSYYNKTEKYYISVQDTIGMSYSKDFIGQVYAQQNKFKESLEKQEESLKLRLALKDSFAIAISYTNLGELYAMQKITIKAKEHFEKAFSISDKLGYKDLNVYLLGKMSEICLEQGDFKCAFDYLTLQTALKETMLDEEKHKQLAEMQTKYETAKKEVALEQEIVKNKNRTLLLILLIGAVIVLCIVIVLIIQRRKLDKQKSEITTLQKVEDERSRIARDLHDNLGAELTLITSKIDMKSYKTKNESDIRDLEDIRTISSNANFILRETIWSIHKQELTVDELYQKAKEYTNRIFSDKGVQTDISVTDRDSKLSPSIALHLYRIIQESVNNASKYSDCTELHVSISNKKITIQDNGKGFDVAHIKKGYGLQNIKQRAGEINGNYTIHSEAEKGATITVNF